TTLTRSINLLERDGVIERAPHPDRRVKALRPTARGRRILQVARPLWTRAQDTVLRELGTTAWADARRRLAHLRDVAVQSRGRGRTRPSPRPRRGRREPGCEPAGGLRRAPGGGAGGARRPRGTPVPGGR